MDHLSNVLFLRLFKFEPTLPCYSKSMGRRYWVSWTSVCLHVGINVVASLCCCINSRWWGNWWKICLIGAEPFLESLGDDIMIEGRGFVAFVLRFWWVFGLHPLHWSRPLLSHQGWFCWWDHHVPHITIYSQWIPRIPWIWTTRHTVVFREWNYSAQCSAPMWMGAELALCRKSGHCHFVFNMHTTITLIAAHLSSSQPSSRLSLAKAIQVLCYKMLLALSVQASLRSHS